MLHAVLFGGFAAFVELSGGFAYSLKDYTFAFLFSACYFMLVWNDLYSKPYHHYLRNAFFFIFRDLVISSLFLFAIESVWMLFRGSSSFTRFIEKDLLLVSWYVLAHVLQYLWIIHLANLGFFRKNVVLIGSYDERLPVEDLFQNINNTKFYIGQLTWTNQKWYFRAKPSDTPEPITKKLSDFLFSHNVNELIICLDKKMGSKGLEQCANFCNENSIGYYLIPDIEQLPSVHRWARRFSSLPLLERFCPNRDLLIMISLKRALDIVVSITGLFILAPVYILIAFFIWAHDRGPVFYISKRVGIHGKIINFVKFRSMVINAEALKESLRKHNERPDGPLFKLTDDPRVTRIGRFLRKTSLDEIPQLWNVLKGDMSLIGPRPHLPDEVAEYSDADKLRLECIPGIACLPQILGRDSLGFREWVDLDLKYRKNWSLKYDFTIFFKTVQVVLRPILHRKSH